MNKYKNLLKDLFVFALGSLGSKLILFLLVPLYTNYLTTDEYGTTELIYTFEQLLVPFLSVVIYEAVVRFGLAKNSDKKSVLKCGFVVITVGSILSIAATPLIGLYFGISEWKWFVAIYVILNMYLSLFQNYLKVQNNNLLYAIVAISQTLSLALLNILFLMWMNLGVKGYMYATFGSYIIAIILCLPFGEIIKSLIDGKLEFKLIKEMIAYSAPLIINNISWWVIHSLDKIMVEFMISTSVLGIYAVSSKIPSLINVITSIFQQAWGISSIKEVESDEKSLKFFSDIFLCLQTAVFGFGIVIILILKPFMTIYVGDSFFEAWQYIPLLLVGASFCAVSSYFGGVYAALKKGVNSMITTLIAAVINIIVNYVGIIYLGIWGAVIGTVSAYIITTFIRLIDSRHYLKFNLHLLNFLLNGLLLLIQAILVSIRLNIYIVSAVALLLFVLINFKSIVRLIIKLKGILHKNEKDTQ